MASPAEKTRARLPRELAVIDADNCTGCGACVEVCPVDCIRFVPQYPASPGLQGWCEIQWDRCIGCRLCVALPRKESEAYTVLVCPWEAIEMVPPADLPAWVGRAAGPVPADGDHRRRLAEMAAGQAELAVNRNSQAR